MKKDSKKKKIKKLTSCPKITLCQVNEDKSVHLAWTEVANAERYTVRRSDSFDGEYKVVEKVTDLEYTDTLPEENKTYWYIIYAVRKISKKKAIIRESSSVYAVASDIPAPDSLEFENKEDGKVCIKWSAPENAKRFLVCRQSGYSNQVMPLGETENNFFNDENLISGQLYYYCIQTITENENGIACGNFCEPLPVANLDCGEIYSVKKRFGNLNITVRVVAGADGYILERSADGITFEEIARNEGETAIRFTLKGSKARFYRTRAYKNAGTTQIISTESQHIKV